MKVPILHIQVQKNLLIVSLSIENPQEFYEGKGDPRSMIVRVNISFSTDDVSLVVFYGGMRQTKKEKETGHSRRLWVRDHPKWIKILDRIF